MARGSRNPTDWVSGLVVATTINCSLIREFRAPRNEHVFTKRSEKRTIASDKSTPLIGTVVYYESSGGITRVVNTLPPIELVKNTITISMVRKDSRCNKT
jgi:hypothetical protein